MNFSTTLITDTTSHPLTVPDSNDDIIGPILSIESDIDNNNIESTSIENTGLEITDDDQLINTSVITDNNDDQVIDTPVNFSHQIASRHSSGNFTQSLNQKRKPLT